MYFYSEDKIQNCRNPSTWATEARGSQIQSQPGLDIKTLSKKEKKKKSRQQWLMPVILTTWEVEIRSQPQANSSEDLSLKNPSQKRAGGATQSVGPEFKPQH
jgi:hypothetical protein